MKKHLALVLALVMVLGSFSFVSAAPDFSDVKDTSFEEAVMSLESLNVLKGYPDGTFKPANTISRAEFAAVAVRVSGLETAAMAAKGLPTGFNDVPAWHWASGYVGTAAKLGIVNGIGNGMFAPEAPVKYEEAITMIVRALGYEPAAAAKGGYPFGYLIVANEIDLLDGALGTQGTFATRGFVAQITFNALETEMMIQSGYGTDSRFVVSGTDGTSEKYLIDQMGFKSVQGRVTGYDLDDLEINMTVAKENGVSLKDSKDKTYDVAEGFDFYRVHGVTVKAWLDGDKVVLTKLVDNVMFDATTFTAGKDVVKLVNENKEYDLDGKAFYLNNSLKKFADDSFNASYAKVVMDGKKIVWADGVNLTKFVVVKEVDSNDLVDFDDNEYNVKDYLIVKDGKTISKDALEAGEVVFLYNSKYFDYKGLGVVATNVEKGVVTKAYTNSFKLDGETYDLTDIGTAQYLDDKDQGNVDADALSAFEDEGKEIKVVLDFAGNVVLMDGTRGVAKTSTYGAILTEKAVQFDGRRDKEIVWDLVNEMGEKVSFDTKSTTEEAVGFIDTDVTNTSLPNKTIAQKWAVVEYVVKDNGGIEKVTSAGAIESTTNSAFKVTDRYEPNGNRLKDSTVVFLVDRADDEVDKVFTWKDAKDNFGEVKDYNVYANDKGEVTYLVVFNSDAGGDYTWKSGVIIESLKVAGKTEYDVIINVDGTKEELRVKNSADFSVIGVGEAKKGDVVEFKVNSDMTDAKNFRTPVDQANVAFNNDSSVAFVDIDLSAKTINTLRVTNKTVILNKDIKVKTLSELKDMAKDGATLDLTIYMDGKVKDNTGTDLSIYSANDIKYVVVNDTAGGSGSSSGDMVFTTTSGGIVVTNVLSGTEVASDYFVKVSGDANAQAIYSTASAVVGTKDVKFTIAVTPAGVYTVELVRVSDLKTIKTKNMLLP